jgi:hypothetical protein
MKNYATGGFEPPTHSVVFLYICMYHWNIHSSFFMKFFKQPRSSHPSMETVEPVAVAHQSAGSSSLLSPATLFQTTTDELSNFSTNFRSKGDALASVIVGLRLCDTPLDASLQHQIPSVSNCKRLV